MDDYNWKLKVVQRVPLYIGELEREEIVEWVVEQAACDLGLLQVEYTRCDALPRPFCSGAVGASLWALTEDDDGELAFEYVKGWSKFRHIGLAKRWAAAQQELWSVADANASFGGEEWRFQEEDDDWGFD